MWLLLSRDGLSLVALPLQLVSDLHYIVAIQYLFLVMVEDAFAEPERHKYLFIEPFQLKARFYPLAMFLLLMVTSMRVDLVVPFLLGVASYFGKVNIGASKISAKLN